MKTKKIESDSKRMKFNLRKNKIIKSLMKKKPMKKQRILK